MHGCDLHRTYSTVACKIASIARVTRNSASPSHRVRYSACFPFVDAAWMIFAMTADLFVQLGCQLRALRKARSLTQPALAERVGRDRARISELERDLVSGRMGRDRLTLLVELCDALGVVPVLLPPDRAAMLLAPGEGRPPAAELWPGAGSTFDDIFVDLSDEG